MDVKDFWCTNKYRDILNPFLNRLNNFPKHTQIQFCKLLDCVETVQGMYSLNLQKKEKLLTINFFARFAYILAFLHVFYYENLIQNKEQKLKKRPA